MADCPGVESYWGTGRTEAFRVTAPSAIAITLLILEVNVPETAFDNLWRGIIYQRPSDLAYVTSFITIGGIWLAHHGIFLVFAVREHAADAGHLSSSTAVCSCPSRPS